jgi:HK97 family phage major capsid protein
MKPEELRKLLAEQLTMRTIAPQPSTYDPKAHSVEFVAATEDYVEVFDWSTWSIIRQVLLMDGMVIPGTGQVPLLDSHDRYSVESVLGSAREWRTEGGKAICRGYFTSTEEGLSAETKVAEGHLTDISVGYRVLDRVEILEGSSAIVGNKEFMGPCQVVRSWLVKELSLCPIGADEDAKVRMTRMTPEFKQFLIARGLSPSASAEEMIDFMKREFTESHQPSRKESPMTPEELAAKEKADTERKAAEQKALDDARTAAATEARDRVDSICKTADQFRTDVKDMDTLKEEALKDNWPSERFYKEVLNRMSKPRPVAAPAAPSIMSIRDFVKPWQKRAVFLLHAKTEESNGRQDNARSWFKRFDEAVSSMTDGQRAAEEFEALEKITKSGLPDEQQYRLASSLTDGAGKYLVPTPLLAEIFILVEKWGVGRRYFRSVPMVADTLKLDTLVTEATAGWTTQGSNITAGDLVFGQGELSVAKLAGISAWSSELEESQAIAWLPIFTASLARAIYKKEDLAGFIGDGTASYGGMTGILAGSTNVLTLDAGKTSFSDADAIDYKALRDKVNIDFREGAMYFLSPADVSNLEGLKDLQGRFIYREPAAGLPAMLWGYPIADNVGINALTQASAANTRFAAFGNPKHMLMGMKRQLDLVVSREGVIQAGDNTIAYNALQADGAIVRMTERIGHKLVLPNGIAAMKTAAA